MTAKLGETTVDDLFEPCERCKDAKPSAELTSGKRLDPDATLIFSLSDSANCPLCHGTKKMLNPVGQQIRRLALQLRDSGFLRP